jgi:hypothetical protein
VPPASSAPWQALARDIAAPWPGLQNPDGTFPDYVFGGQPGFSARYGESILGYGLLLSGVRQGDEGLVDAGLNGLSYAVGRSDLQQSRPSVFENLAVAAAYNLGRRRLADDQRFLAVRRDWAHWLRRVRLLRVDATQQFVNKQVVETAGTLEALRTGVHSSDRRAVLGGQRGRARSLVLDFVNRRVPSIALRDGVEVGGERTLVLSDPASNPLAYHALSLGMLARAVDLLGARTTAAARAALRDVVRASWRFAGPDGDLSYVGRSQEQAWTLSCTAYGAEVAAALGGDSEERRRLRALSERALARLRDRYGVGDRGLWITPALALDHSAGLRGLDGYAGATVYNGLTLVALEWALERMRSARRDAGELAADRPAAYRLSRREGELALVRTGATWFAVKRATSRADFPQDLRYDFGLVAFKRDHGGGWTDLMPLRPRTKERPDSAGPVLHKGNRRALPYGRRLRIGDDGTVRIGGGFMLDSGEWLRSGVTFRFEPDGEDVRMTFGALRGERFEFSAFFREGAKPPTAESHGVSDEELRARCSEPIELSVEEGYSSGADPKLLRARLRFRAGADGPVWISLGPAHA